MGIRRKFPRFGRAAMLGALLLAMPAAHSQSSTRHGDEAPTPPKLNAQEAADRLNKFRGMRLPYDYCARFVLLSTTNDRKEARYEGVIWGTWNDQGPLTRIQIRPIAPKNSGNTTAADSGAWEWLVQNGREPRVWALAPGASAAKEIPAAQWREPLFPRMVYSPFDLLTPFVFWADFQYVGPSRFRGGRSTDIYLMLPPKDAAGAAPVKIYLDREFSAPLRAEIIDAKGKPARTLDLESFQKVDEDNYLPTSYGLLDEARKDYDVLTLAAVALRLKLAPAIFDPAKLATPAPPPPPDAWTKL